MLLSIDERDDFANNLLHHQRVAGGTVDIPTRKYGRTTDQSTMSSNRHTNEGI